MANTKLSDLTAITVPASADEVYINDISDTTDSPEGSSRKITLSNLFSQVDELNTSIVTETSTDTLTNKTIDLGDNTITGTTAEFNAALSDGDFATLAGTETLSGKTLTAPKFVEGGFIADENGNEILQFSYLNNAVNHLQITNAIAGNDPQIFSVGGDTDIDIILNPKGDGFVAIVGDMNLESTSNIRVEGAAPKRTMYVPASAMYPSTTSPCAALTQVESSTNDVNIKVLDFDGAGTSKEYAEFGIQSPTYWDAGTVTAQFIWYATAGSGTVNWEIQGLALSDDDALDTAYGTLEEVTDTLLATGDVHITAETDDITIAGSPVAGDWLQFKVARDPANDTNTSDARLMGVRIRFGIAKFNDR